MKKAVTALGIACLAVVLYILHLPFIFGQTATGFIFIQCAYAGHSGLQALRDEDTH